MQYLSYKPHTTEVGFHHTDIFHQCKGWHLIQPNPHHISNFVCGPMYRNRFWPLKNTVIIQCSYMHCSHTSMMKSNPRDGEGRKFVSIIISLIEYMLFTIIISIKHVMSFIPVQYKPYFVISVISFIWSTF